MNAVEQDDFDDLEKNVRDLDKGLNDLAKDFNDLDGDFEKRVELTVAKIFKEMATKCGGTWSNYQWGIRFNSVAKELESRNA